MASLCWCHYIVAGLNPDSVTKAKDDYRLLCVKYKSETNPPNLYSQIGEHDLKKCFLYCFVVLIFA